MYENMQKFIKICNNTSKYAENMQKSKICKNKFLNFSLVYSFLVSLGHQHYFKHNLYFYVKYAKFRALVIILRTVLQNTRIDQPVQVLYCTMLQKYCTGIYAYVQICTVILKKDMMFTYQYQYDIPVKFIKYSICFP